MGVEPDKQGVGHKVATRDHNRSLAQSRRELQGVVTAASTPGVKYYPLAKLKVVDAAPVIVLGLWQQTRAWLVDHYSTRINQSSTFI